MRTPYGGFNTPVDDLLYFTRFTHTRECPSTQGKGFIKYGVYSFIKYGRAGGRGATAKREKLD